MQQTDKEKIISQASEWLMRLQEGNLSPQEQHQLEQWQQQSTLHQKIWTKALQLQDKFSDVPNDVIVPVMDKIQFYDQHRYKKYLWLFAIIPALSALYYVDQQQQLSADYRSGVGERKTIRLMDGGKIILNGRSAIDIEYSNQQRLIVLRKGEIWIETAKDDLKRPFLVETRQGTAQALGTKYLVKMDDQSSFVAVAQGAVKITTKQSQQQNILQLDQQTYFDGEKIGNLSNFSEDDIAWTKGFLMVNDLPLKDFVERLQPYQKSVIQLEPKVENLKISGTYPIDDLQKVYQMLAQTYDLEVNHYAQGYWISIKQRNN